MPEPRPLRAPAIAHATRLLALLTLAGLLLGACATSALALPTATPPALPSPTPTILTTPDQPSPLLRVGGDARLEAGQTTDAIVVLGGDADVAGTVRTSVVVVGGDAVIRSTARIGTQMKANDASIVVVGGELKEAPGAVVTGTTQVVSLTAPRINITGAVWHALTHPGGSVIGWWANTIFCFVITVVVVALFGRQTRAIRDRAYAEPLASLGWGALIAFLTLVVALILAATIIGLIVVIPGILFSPLVVLFVMGTAALGVGELLLRRLRPQSTNAYLAALIGVVVLQLLGLIPVVGGLVGFAAWLAALGATGWALSQWWKVRQAHRSGGGGAAAPAAAD
jgi:hypothetical protein